MDRRNILILVSTIAIVLLLGGGAYWYFSKKTAPLTLVPGNTFPAAGSGVYSQGSNSSSPSKNTLPAYTPGSGTPLPKLYELHKQPVAGAGFYESGKGSTLSISARYIERSLGNIFDTPLSTLTETRISNETRPRIAEAFWGNLGKSVVVRTLDDKTDGLVISQILNLSATTLSQTIATSSSPSQFVKTEEISLPDGIPFLAAAGDNSDKFFYLAQGGSGTLGFLSGFKSSAAIKIFDSAFTEWLPQLPNSKLVTLTTKPSADVPGYMFFTYPDTKTTKKVLDGIKGLTTLTSADGSYVLYSETKDGAPQMSVYNMTKKEVHPLSIQTLPEKCVWSNKNKATFYCAVPKILPTGIYPDQWYQGLLSFSDALWQIDAGTLEAHKIMDPADVGGPDLDMTNLLISSNGNYILFVDKISGDPWVYRTTDITPPSQPVSTPTITSKTQTILPAAITPDMQKIK